MGHKCHAILLKGCFLWNADEEALLPGVYIQHFRLSMVVW
jgi:hypothetical protein